MNKLKNIGESFRRY